MTPTPKFITLTTPEGPLILNTNRIETIEQDEDGRTCVVMAGRDEMHVVAERMLELQLLLRSVAMREPKNEDT